MRRIFLVLLSAVVFISGCTPPLRISESKYHRLKLTSELAESRDKDFFVQVPHVWFHTKDINYDGNEIWLVKENYSGVVVIRKINLAVEAKQKDKIENLLELAKTNALLHKRKNEPHFKMLSTPQLYQNGDLVYASFEYRFGENQIARVVIFEKDRNYFECFAYSTEKGSGKIALLELYSIQESVVLSLNTQRH